MSWAVHGVTHLPIHDLFEPKFEIYQLPQEHHVAFGDRVFCDDPAMFTKQAIDLFDIVDAALPK